MIKPTSLKNKDYILALILIIIFLSEGINKCSEIIFNTQTPYALIIKAFILCCMILYILVNNDTFFIRAISILFVVFCLGQMFTPSPFRFDSIYIFVKYLFPLFVFRVFSENKLELKSKVALFSVFEILMLLNGVLIIFGVWFDIKLFETYRGNRFGYNGLFYTSASGTYAYIIFLFYTYWNYTYKSKKSFFVNLLALFPAFFLGTKSVYLSLFLIIIHFILFKFNSKNYIKLILSTMFGSIALITFYFFLFEYSIFEEISKRKGLITSILSNRDELLNNTVDYISVNWSAINYFFGGVDDISTRSQLGFVDLFYFFGLIGGSIYLFCFYRFYFTFKISSQLAFLFIVLTTVVFLAGNFFLYTIPPIFLVIFREKLKSNLP